MEHEVHPDFELKERNENNAAQENHRKLHKKEQVTKSCSKIFLSFFSFFTVEPFLLCYVLPLAIMGLAINKLNAEKACRVDLKYTEEICTKALNPGVFATDNVTDANFTEAVKIEALELVSEMQSWQIPLASSVPLILVLFVGAWSDRTGNRKILMLMPILGELVSVSGLILATYYFEEWPLWVTALIEAVPTALSGGLTIALMGAFSYIADVTTLESRTFRMGVVAIIVTLGYPFGTSLSGILIQKLGYYGVFGIGFSTYIIGFMHTMLRVHDVRKVQTEGTVLDKIKLFFHPKNVWDTLSVLFLSRGLQRIQIILVICAHIVVLGPAQGEGPILYQYTLAKYNMDEVELSMYSTFATLIGTAGTTVAVTLFSRLLKMHDSFLGIIATACKVMSSFVYGLAPTKWWFYSGAAFDFFGNSGTTAIRSLGSKVVAPTDVAKMASIIGFAEAILPMVYGPLFLQVFVKTVKDYPGAVYLLGGVLTVPAFVLFIVLYILHKKQEKDTVKNPAKKEMHAYDNDVTAL